MRRYGESNPWAGPDRNSHGGGSPTARAPPVRLLSTRNAAKTSSAPMARVRAVAVSWSGQ